MNIPENKLFMNINRKNTGADVYEMTLLIKLKDKEVAEPYNPVPVNFNGKLRITDLKLNDKIGVNEFWCEKFTVNANRSKEDAIRVRLVDEAFSEMNPQELHRDSGKVVQQTEQEEQSDSTQTVLAAMDGELDDGEVGGTSGSYEP